MPLFRRLHGQRQELKQNFEELLLFICLVEGRGKGSIFENVQKVRGDHFV